MKNKLFLIALIGMAFTSVAHAGRFGSGGVERITKADGDRYHVYCRSGGDKVIAPVGQGWGDDTHNSFGDSFNRLSLEQAAEKGCS